MIPRIGKQGSSFRGASLYYLKDKKADTDKRVEWTHTENMATDDPEMAWRLMAYTAMSSEKLKRQSGEAMTGNKSEKPVWTLSLSWHPEQQPDQEHMIDTMNSALAALGLRDRQTLMCAHNDTDHPHLHAIVNLCHPITGRTAELEFSKEKLSRWAEKYEREYGDKIYCEQRVENNEKRDQEKAKRKKDRDEDAEPKKAKFPRHKDPEVDFKAEITRLYNETKTGEEFKAAVEELGFKLAQGDRILLIDREGNQHSITRQIEGAKAKDVRAKLAGIELPDIDEARRQQKEQGEKERAMQATQDDEELQRRAEEELIPVDQATHDDEADRRRQAEAEFIPFEQEEDFALAEPEELLSITAEANEAYVDRKEGPELLPSPGTLNQLQNRQSAEMGDFFDRSHREKQRIEAELEAAYGKNERLLRHQIPKMRMELENAGMFKRFLMKITGQLARQRQEIAEKQKTLQNIEMRKQERIEPLQARIDAERQQMVERHQKERELALVPKKQAERLQEKVPSPSRSRTAPGPARASEPANENTAPQEFRKAASGIPSGRVKSAGPSKAPTRGRSSGPSRSRG